MHLAVNHRNFAKSGRDAHQDVQALPHMRIGMQVIIEDYVNQPLLRVLALMANSFFSALVGIASAVALIKITFGA